MEAVENSEAPGRDVSPRLRYATVPVILIGVLFLFLLWQSFDYIGAVSALAEWQFTHFHQWYPALTALIFCAIVALLWLLVMALLKSRRRKRESWSRADEHAARVRSMAIGSNALLILAGLCATFVLTGLVYWWLLPTMGSGPARPWYAAGPVREGRTSLAGAQIVGPIARYREAIFGIGPDQYFAPLGKAAKAGDTGGDPAPLTLFVELTPLQGRPRLPADQQDGLLRARALPGELVALYRAAGYAVADQPAVIFRSDAASGRPTLVFMVEALVGGLISLAFGLLLRWRYRRLLRRR